MENMEECLVGNMGIHYLVGIEKKHTNGGISSNCVIVGQLGTQIKLLINKCILNTYCKTNTIYSLVRQIKPLYLEGRDLVPYE